MQNLGRVPKIEGRVDEVQPYDPEQSKVNEEVAKRAPSLSSLTTRTPDIRLGIGLPMSRIYAEYWAGSLEVHSLEGYGTDVFLQISKLGNKNEQITTRATMDAV